MIELKDVFTREDPQELNIKLNNVQVEKQKVIEAMILAESIHSPARQVIHSYLRRNYKRAIDETKKNAGIEALELWAVSDMPATEANPYDQYMLTKERLHFLDKVRTSLETDMSALQSRIRIFKETC